QSAELIGPRARSVGTLTGRGKTWRAVIPLRAARWGGPALPLPVADYRLLLVDADGGEATVEASVPLTQLGTLRAGLDGGVVRIGPPIDPAYDSGEGQAAL